MMAAAELVGQAAHMRELAPSLVRRRPRTLVVPVVVVAVAAGMEVVEQFLQSISAQKPFPWFQQPLQHPRPLVPAPSFSCVFL